VSTNTQRIIERIPLLLSLRLAELLVFSAIASRSAAGAVRPLFEPFVKTLQSFHLLSLYKKEI
jgi:hypothetical protein